MLSVRQVAQTLMLRGVRTGYAKRNHKDTYSSSPLLVMGSLICGSALGFGCCENTKKKKNQLTCRKTYFSSRFQGSWSCLMMLFWACKWRRISRREEHSGQKLVCSWKRAEGRRKCSLGTTCHFVAFFSYAPPPKVSTTSEGSILRIKLVINILTVWRLFQIQTLVEFIALGSSSPCS